MAQLPGNSLQKMFQEGFGFAALPGEEQLALDQKNRQEAMIQASKQKRLQEQMLEAQALRDQQPDTNNVASALGGLFNKAAGMRDVKQTKTDQGVVDQRLAKSTAAAQEAAVQKGMRGEQNTLASALQAYHSEGLDREEKGKDRASSERIALQRTLASQQSKHGVEDLVFENNSLAIDDPNRLLQVQRAANVTTGEVSYTWRDPATGEIVTDKFPPKDHIIDPEGRKQAAAQKLVRVKGEEKRLTQEQKGFQKIAEITLEGAQRLTLQDRKDIASYGRQELKGTQAIDQIGFETTADIEKIGAQKYADIALEKVKADSSWKRLVEKHGHEKAQQIAEMTIKERMETAKITSRELIAGDALEAEVEMFADDVGYKERRDLQTINTKADAAALKFQNDMSEESHKQLLMANREKEDWVQKQKLAKLEAEAELKAGQKMSPKEISDGLSKFGKDVATIEEFSNILDETLEFFAPFAKSGGNAPGIGPGETFMNEVIKYRSQAGGQAGATLATSSQKSSDRTDSSARRVYSNANPGGGASPPGYGGRSGTEDRTGQDIGTGEGKRTLLSGKGAVTEEQTMEVNVPSGAIGEAQIANDPVAQRGAALMGQLIAIIGKKQSGLEVPNAEFLRIQRGLGVGGQIDDKTFFKMLNTLAEQSNMMLKQTRARTGPQVMEAYMGIHPESKLGGDYTFRSLEDRWNEGQGGSESVAAWEEGVTEPAVPVPQSQRDPLSGTLATVAALRDPNVGTLNEDSPIRRSDISNPAVVSQELMGGGMADRTLQSFKNFAADKFDSGVSYKNAIRDFVKGEKSVLADSKEFGEQWSYHVEEGKVKWNAMREDRKDEWWKENRGLISKIMPDRWDVRDRAGMFAEYDALKKMEALGETMDWNKEYMQNTESTVFPRFKAEQMNPPPR